MKQIRTLFFETNSSSTHSVCIHVRKKEEVVYHNTIQELESLGVLFCDTDTALRRYPEIFKEYFAKVVPVADNMFSALNTAVWSGGSFIYIPKGVTLTAKGGDANWNWGAGAGIHVPNSSTLVLLGEGKVVAQGGNAGN